jgi:hypothetical protein
MAGAVLQGRSYPKGVSYRAYPAGRAPLRTGSKGLTRRATHEEGHTRGGPHTRVVAPRGSECVAPRGSECVAPIRACVPPCFGTSPPTLEYKG